MEVSFKSIRHMIQFNNAFPGPNMVARTIAAYHRSGVAGLHIEDQIQTKRCGHLGGKEIVSFETWIQRISAATQARDRLGSEMLIIARTDALQTHDFQEAAKRLKAAADMGADVAFLEGLSTKAQMRDICRIMHPTPVLLNMVEHGATPSISPQEAQDIGFRIIIFPFAAIAPAYKAIKDSFVRIKETGFTELENSFTPKKLFSIVGLKKAAAIDAAAGGHMYDRV